MPKLYHRLTAKLGEWHEIPWSPDGPGTCPVMLTRPPGPHNEAEAVLWLGDGTRLIVHPDWETLERWGCAEAFEGPGDPPTTHPATTVSGTLVEMGDSEEHGATVDNEQVCASVVLPVQDARKLGPSLGRAVWITPWP